MKHALLLLAFIATQAHARIIYTDVIPDASCSGTNATCFLDLDNDGNIDFLIVQSTLTATCTPACQDSPNSHPNSSVKITPQGTNAAARGASYISQLPQGQVIDPALTWNNGSDQVLMRQVSPTCVDPPGPPVITVCSPMGFLGEWLSGTSETTPKFIGLRFENAGSTFYGWAGLSIPADGTSLTLRDYAYNSAPGEAILAGDVGFISTGITSTALRGMQLAPNPFSSVLSIALRTGTTGAVNYRELSLLDQELLTCTFAATGGPSAITLDLASLASGTYLLEIETDGECIVRKVVKE